MENPECSRIHRATKMRLTRGAFGVSQYGQNMLDNMEAVTESKAGVSKFIDISRDHNVHEKMTIGGVHNMTNTTQRGDSDGSNIGINAVKDRSLELTGHSCLSYSQLGTVLSPTNNTLIQSSVRTCTLQMFSTIIEKEVVGRFMNIEENVRAYVKSPALMWYKDELILTFRIRLRSGRRSYDRKREHCFGYRCNHIYMRRYDRYLNPIGEGELITINTPLGPHLERNGPHDARLFQINGNMYSLFATGYIDSWISGIWDYQKRTHFIPDFQKKLIRERQTIFEKNWVPIVINNTLYIIRHFDPMHIIRCDIHKSCDFTRNDTDALRYKMLDSKVPLRGGTSFEPYKHPYYIGIGHSTNYNGTKRFYTSHLMAISVEPVFRIIYVSDPIEIKPAIYSYFTGKVIWKAVQGNFIFPVGLLIENENSIVIGAHVNDHGSLLLRMEGIKSIMDQVISVDKVNGDHHVKQHPFRVQKYVLNRMNQLYPDRMPYE